MKFWSGMCKINSWFGWIKNSDPASQVLVSIYVKRKSMPSRGFSRVSRRILLTASIWSVIILVFAFFVTYTILLIYVDRPSVSHVRPKVKFLGRDFRSRNGTGTQVSSNSFQPRRFWSPKYFDDPSSEMPYCKHGSLFIVIITSSPEHFEHRKEIRNTWCNPKLSTQDDNTWQCVFLIGQTYDLNISLVLQLESQNHRDILRGSYLDSYRNLTYKVMHGFAWLSTKCETPYALKTDDDCFVNTLLFWQFLLHYNTQTSNLYAGNMVVKKEKRKVIRKLNEKWSVSVDDYSSEYYPIYASGSGYAVSFDVVLRAVEDSEFIKPIPNEDAYIGIVMDHLGIKPTLSGRFTLSSAGLRLCNYAYIFVAHDVLPSMHKDIHNKMMAAQSDCQHEDIVKTWF